MPKRLLVLALLLTVTSCTAPDPKPAPTTAKATATRGCESSVHGDLGPDWRQRALIIGPLAFLIWFSEDRSWFDSISPRPDGRYFIKVLATVDRSKQATLSLPDSERAQVSLDYLDGSPYVVTFVACTDGKPETQFNGGFMVNGPRCVPILVGFDGRTERRVLSFGAGKCAT